MSITLRVSANTAKADSKIRKTRQDLNNLEKKTKKTTDEAKRTAMATSALATQIATQILSIMRGLGISFGKVIDSVISAVVSSIGQAISLASIYVASGPTSPLFYTGLAMMGLAVTAQINAVVVAAQLKENKFDIMSATDRGANAKQARVLSLSDMV